jgi:hypothetical protein
VGKRSRKRAAGKEPVRTTDYTDDDGNVLTLRHTDAELPAAHRSAASSRDDEWHREAEIRFERYAVRWEISGLVYEKQKELLARYRMADSATQAWVQRTIDRHIEAA